MNRPLRMAGLISIVVIGVASILASGGGTRPEPEPRITLFSVTNPVCLNTTLPLIRIHYEFDPDGWTNPDTLCTNVLANGTRIHPEMRHMCLDDGTAGDLTFNPLQFFGNNVPPQITVTVELVPLVAGNAYDSRSGTVTTIANCPPPSPAPAP